MRVWIVGANSGVGLELVRLWLSSGAFVVASARYASQTQALHTLMDTYGDHLSILDVDVVQKETLAAATREAWERFGGLDLFFYNAGIYEAAPLSQWDLTLIETMCEINYLGAARLLYHVQGYFQTQGSGHMVFNASAASYFGLPYGGGYSAPKAALVNMLESLHPELAGYNIAVQVVDHGFVRTRLTAKNDFKMPQLLEPQEAARAIIKGIKHPRRFEIRFPWGLLFMMRLLRVLPYAVSLRLTRKMVA